jgi:hypothetical protein
MYNIKVINNSEKEVHYSDSITIRNAYGSYSFFTIKICPAKTVRL